MALPSTKKAHARTDPIPFLDLRPYEQRLGKLNQTSMTALAQRDLVKAMALFRALVDEVVPEQHRGQIIESAFRCIGCAGSMVSFETRKATRSIGVKVATDAARATGDQARDITRAVSARNPGLTLEKLRLKVLEARAPVFGKRDDISVSAISRHLKADPEKKSRKGHN